jgi:hypothetical protein
MIDKIKSHLAPILASILGLLIWTDLQTIKSKLDVLMEERASVKQRLDNNEKSIEEFQKLFPRKIQTNFKQTLFIKDDKFPKINQKKYN